MKRLGSSDSLGGLMSICPSSTDEQQQQHMSPGSGGNNNYSSSREFRSMLDGLVDEEDEPCGIHVPEKKRRLSVEQVKALEKNFEVENKLEPERKVKLAQELGLQPRQVAVWFQNRRARWKTKQLERDYGVLKANYDSLKQNFDALQQDNEALLKEIRELKSKLNVEEEDHVVESNNSPAAPWVKDETNTMASESDNQQQLLIETTTTTTPVDAAAAAAASTPQPMESSDHHHHQAAAAAAVVHNSDNVQLTSVDFFAKDGPSDSDSSAILNEENSPNELHHHQHGHHQLSFAQQLRFNCSSSSNSPPPLLTTYFSHLSDGCGAHASPFNNGHHPTTTTTFVKMEEHDFFSEEACNFYAEDHAPTLHNLYTAAADHHHWT